MPTIQIFGTKKCKDTRKAERFFRERGIGYQFVDLNEKGMSRGELESIASAISPENLINRESREFERLNLKYMDFDIKETILEHPLVTRTPVVRCGGRAVCGFDPEGWRKISES